MHMPRYSEPYACRLYEVPVEAAGDVRPRGARSDRRWVYTTSGIGFSTVDTRLLCPPELVVIDA
jgi:predicted MPP superfamily phosphohydrolase